MNATNWNGAPGACGHDPVEDVCGDCGEWVASCVCPEHDPSRCADPHCAACFDDAAAGYDEDDVADERLDREREGG